MIVAGGGLAGRSLAYFLSGHPGLGEMRILLVDDSRHYQHRSIIYWYDGVLPLRLTPSVSYTASYCCDSTTPPPGATPPPLMTGEIRQVRTASESFDPSVATFMDFRSGDGRQPVRLHCLLPVSTREAFVETTRITRGDAPALGWPFGTAAAAYLRNTCGVTDFSTLAVQRGVIPLGLRRQSSRGRHLYVGTASGIIKATTGYGFTRILHQAERVASSFAATGSPSGPDPPRRFHFYDKPVLKMWLHDPDSAVRSPVAPRSAHGTVTGDCSGRRNGDESP